MSVAARRARMAAGAGPRTLAPNLVGVPLAAWYAADQIAGPPADNTALSAWADVSGNSRNLAQATGGNQPTFQTNEINGLPVVRFDGSNDRILSAGFTTLAQPNTIVIVARLSALTSGRVFMDGDATARNVVVADAAAGYRLYAGSFGDTSVAATTNATVLTARFNGASSSLRRDGTQIGGTLNPGSQGIHAVFLGAFYDGSSPMAGDIAEVCVYNADLTATQGSQVERFLGAKYGITVA